jgi:hypothetical protein
VGQRHQRYHPACPTPGYDHLIGHESCERQTILPDLTDTWNEAELTMPISDDSRDHEFSVAATIALAYITTMMTACIRSFSVKKDTPMRWLREARILRLVLFLLLAFSGYLVVYGVAFPLLWPYRDHAVVWFLLAFLSGNHLPELFPEPGAML